MPDRDFWAPERFEDESLEVYHLRLAQQRRHGKSVSRGVRIDRPAPDPLRTLQRTASKTIGARQAKKIAKQARRDNLALKP